MADQPSGTITFLFSDIEGSSDLWERFPTLMQTALAKHDRLMYEVVEQHSGYLVKTTGDGILAAFERAPDAARAGVAIQQALQTHDWGEIGQLRVRIGLHTGTAQYREDDYFGPAVNRAARLMSIGHGGQILISVSTRDLLVDEMPKDLTLQDLGRHQLKDLTRPEHVYQLNHPNLEEEFPPLTSLDQLPHNLPRQLTSFIGRDQDVRSVIEHFSKESLVTLTGPGGVGKTRLALQVSAELSEDYPDGIWWVDLAPLFEPELVPNAVAEVLGIKEQSGKSLRETLTAQLERKKVLLILDNCEHLIDACADFVEQLLKDCPYLAILSTSREVLHVSGEAVWAVPPFGVPDSDTDHSPQKLMEYKAIQFFVDRAQASDAAFQLTQANARAVAQLCRQLDGLPLALELAAARVRTLSVAEIVDHLVNRFQFLTSRSREESSRHQSLQATLEWSYNLLAEDERVFLRRLSVFRGSWSVEAAQAICLEDTAERIEVLDQLSDLVDKSLIEVEKRRGHTRYRLFETIREFSEGQLESAGESHHIRDRYLAYFLALAEDARPKLETEDVTTWLEQLEAEHDNFRAALTWAMESENVEAALRLSGALGQFWHLRGYLAEGRSWLTRALQINSATDDRARLKALLNAGGLAQEQAEYDEARDFLTEGLNVAKKLDDNKSMVLVLNLLGIVEMKQGNLATQIQFHHEGLEIARAIEYKHGVYLHLLNLAVAEGQNGNIEYARSLLTEGLEIARTRFDKAKIVTYLMNLGNVERRTGNLEAARALFQEAYELAQEIGSHRESSALILNNLGLIALDQGDYSEASLRYTQALSVSSDIENRRERISVFPGIASLLHAQGQHMEATQLLGAVDALINEIGAELDTDDSETFKTNADSLAHVLGSHNYSQAYQAGQSLSLEQATNLAKREMEYIGGNLISRDEVD